MSKRKLFVRTIVSLVFLLAPTYAKNYDEISHTEPSEDTYSYQYKPLYKLKATKDYVYKTVPVYLDYSPQVQNDEKVAENPVQELYTPQTDYSTSDEQYTKAYVPVKTSASYVPSNEDVSEVQYKKKYKEYKYGYRVTDAHTGTDYGHSEVHDGNTAKGYYHVLLPDGRLQNVRYWAGDSGYNAVVTYEN